MKRLFLFAAVPALAISFSVTAVAQASSGGVACEHRAQTTSGEAIPGLGLDSAASPAGGLRPSAKLGELRQEQQRLEDQAARVAALLQRLKERDDQEAGLARQYAMTPQGVPLGLRTREADIKRLTAELKKLVGAAFDARQQLQQAEVAAGREQLHRIEKSMQSNERSKEELIEQRVKELLDTRSSELDLKLRWESDVSKKPGESLPSAEDTVWRLTIRGAEAKEVPNVLKALTELNQTISFSMIEGNTNTIVAQGTLDNLKSLRQSLHTLEQSEAAKDLPRDLAIEINGLVFSGIGSKNEPGTSTCDKALHSFPLKNASAKELAPLLAKLLAPHVTVEADERTNSLFLFGTAESLDAAKKLIELLDQKAEQPSGISGENSISELFDGYLNSIWRSQSKKQGGGPADSGKTDAFSKILKTIIQEEFEKRQTLLREELESLRKRLDAIEKKIASREATVNEIVERRVEELLSGGPSTAPENSGRTRESQVDPGSKAEQREAFVASFPDTVTEDVRTQEPNPETSLQQFVDISPDERFAATVQNGEDERSYVLTLWEHHSGRAVRKTKRPGAAATVRFAESGTIAGVHRFLENEIDLFHVPSGRFVNALAYPRSRPWQAALNEFAAASPVSLGVGMHGGQGEVKIMRVRPGTGAEKAGLREGDQILALDGRTVSDVQEVVDRIMWRNPGEEANLKILRGGEILTVKVELMKFQASHGQDAVGRSSGGLGSLSQQDNGRGGVALATNADVAIAKQELAAAERKFDETKTLAEQRIVAQSVLEAARNSLESARAKLHKAEREYEAQKTLLLLDLESAELKVKAAQTALQDNHEPFQDTVAHTEQQFALRQAELELKRVQTRLDLHTADQSESKSDEIPPNVESPEEQTDAGTSNPASPTPNVNPSTAVVWVEALFKDPEDDRQTEAAGIVRSTTSSGTV